MRLHRCKTVTKLLFNQTINMNNNCNQTSLQWNLWSWPWFCVPYGNWRFVTDVWVCSIHEGVFHTKLVCVQSVHAHGFTRLTNLGAPLLLWLISNFTCHVCVFTVFITRDLIWFLLVITTKASSSEMTLLLHFPSSWLPILDSKISFQSEHTFYFIFVVTNVALSHRFLNSAFNGCWILKLSHCLQLAFRH